ncbi:hypothetical protein LTR84_004080 [Exophiala bonariae]|uniref:C2H2-type domain-containing protein n=1 Tax=Exophiala bonariae TaxID=1690606 RepID=A0AAV9N5D1_9EURO|nr:hypothetical protein LTR84_004080 [Exophiala bonariae]
MWQAPAGYIFNPENLQTYTPSYDAYSGFSDEKKEPSRSVKPFIHSVISYASRTSPPSHSGQGQSDEMVAAMKRNDTWIERRSEGRYYWVRKKSARSQLSLRHLLFEALRPRARSFFSRDSRHNHHIRCSNPGAPLLLPPPTSSPPEDSQEYTPPPTDPSSYQAQQLPQQVNMNSFPPCQDPPNIEPNGIFAKHHVTSHGQLPLYPPPPPIMPVSIPYPVPGHGLPFILPQPPVVHQAPCFAPPPPQPTPFVLPPPLSQLHHQPQPQPQPQQLPLPGLSSFSSLRYKCDNCGRFRSARFHKRHPIPPGAIPAKTICQRCREVATDTEDDSSSDGYAQRVHRRHSFGARSRNASNIRSARNRNNPRGARGQSSAGEWLNENNHDGFAGPPYSPQTTPIDLSRGRRHNRRSSRHHHHESTEMELSAGFRNLKLVPQEQMFYLESEDEHRPSSKYYKDRSDHDSCHK